MRYEQETSLPLCENVHSAGDNLHRCLLSLLSVCVCQASIWTLSCMPQNEIHCPLFLGEHCCQNRFEGFLYVPLDLI